MLEQILPPAVVVVETDHDEPGTLLFPEEEAVIARAVPKRRHEFAAGRACARRALARLGVPPAPLLPGERGAPSWPDGTTGSITHCAGYRAAAVARTRDVAALGVDAEPNEAVPGGVLGVIATQGERTRIGRLGAADARVSWDRLLFSAKESVYKAWFPLARRWLGFDQADITIGALDGTFTARLLVPGPLVDGSALTVLHGRWVADQGLVATAVVIPAWPAGGGRTG